MFSCHAMLKFPNLSVIYRTQKGNFDKKDVAKHISTPITLNENFNFFKLSDTEIMVAILQLIGRLKWINHSSTDYTAFTTVHHIRMRLTTAYTYVSIPFLKTFSKFAK